MMNDTGSMRQWSRQTDQRGVPNFLGYREARVNVGAAYLCGSTVRGTSPKFVGVMADEDPTTPLNLSTNTNLIFYISRDHSLATRVDDVYSVKIEN